MNSNSESDSEVIQTFQSNRKSCSWCKCPALLVEGKSYCQTCEEKMYKECSRCHLPYPDAKHFKTGQARCNSCQKKYEKEREKRLLNKMNELTSATPPKKPIDSRGKKGKKRAAVDELEVTSDKDDKDGMDDTDAVHATKRRPGGNVIIFI